MLVDDYYWLLTDSTFGTLSPSLSWSISFFAFYNDFFVLGENNSNFYPARILFLILIT